jgi:hypothetical protein
MLKRIFGLLLIVSLAFVSCTKDSYTLSEEDLADSVIDLRTDSLPCFQFVFPISFQLADQSIVEVNSLEEAKTLIDSNNGKLKLVYPVEIIDSNGETLTVADHDQMHSILADCGIVPDNYLVPKLSIEYQLPDNFRLKSSVEFEASISDLSEKYLSFEAGIAFCF